MTYHHALGEGPVIIPAATEHPYATMPVCDVQRHLIAAGKRISADGAWGPLSKSAFSDWAKSRPLSESSRVHPNGLPTFGGREDYKMDGTKIRIPEVYAISLPAMAQVPCRGALPSRTNTSADTEVDTETEDIPGRSRSLAAFGTYGPWLLAVVAAAAGGGYWYWSKRKHSKAAP